ncbi:hypothetical protein [Glycomyces sp. NPDC047010]|uniref:hypothetical protein n=1 Tax=Glycomyces sp. NPDC047010 TaxID=3155023 RepID=UPI003405D22D
MQDDTKAGRWKLRAFSLVAAFAMLVGALIGSTAQAAEPDFTAEAIASGLTADQAAELQKRVDDVLASIPGGTQVSPTEIAYDGLDVTVDPFASESDYSAAAISCPANYFCINSPTTNYRFYECKTWTLTNWIGTWPYNNNQTTGTVARAYASNGSTVVWSNTAKSSGNAYVTPWWYFRPC